MPEVGQRTIFKRCIYLGKYLISYISKLSTMNCLCRSKKVEQKAHVDLRWD